MKPRRKAVILALLLLALAWPGAAANHYVRAGGTGTGTDWTSGNACGDFTGSCAVSSLVRGDTYYVATGTYAQLVLDKANSGTTLITIKGATTADHGTDTGWVNSYSVSTADGGAQAQFTFTSVSNVVFRTDHWVFDGAVGSGNTLSSYGFLMKVTADCTISPQRYIQVRGAADGPNTDITIKHVALNGCGPGNDTSSYFFTLGCGACQLTNINIAYTYTENVTGALNTTNIASSTWEHNYWEKFFYAGTNSGKEVIAATCSNSGGSCVGLNDNNIFRYNIVKDCNASGYSGGIIGLGPGEPIAMLNWKIYGNVWKTCGGNSGVIAGINGFQLQGVEIDNELFIDIPAQLVSQCEGTCSSASGNKFRNNIIWNGVTGVNQGTGGAWTKDYNTCLSVISTDHCLDDTHGQSGSGDPTVDYVNDNFRLAAGTYCSGLDLSASFTTGLYGGTFDTSNWCRGVEPYVSTKPTVWMRGLLPH